MYRSVSHSFPKAAALAVIVVATLVSAPEPAHAQSANPPSPRAQEAEFRTGFNAYVRGDYEAAVNIWTKLADQGHIKSMNNLGTMYSQGKAVSRNYPHAMYWYRRAAAQGDARSMYNMGIAYNHGRGVERDDAVAASWFKRAADLGLVEAMDALSWVYSTSPQLAARDGTQAVRWAQAAVERKTSSKTLATLAAAHAEAGEYRKAVVAIDRAIEHLKREVDGANMVLNDYDFFGLLRESGRTDEVFHLLERREYYANGQPTRQ